MLTSWLDRLREKPRSTRQTVALVFSAVLTLGIVLLWLVLFQPYSASPPAGADESPEVLSSLSRTLEQVVESIAGLVSGE